MVAALVGLHAARSFARVFLSVPPDSFGCDCTENRFLGRIDPRWFEFVSTTFRWLYPVALLAGAVVVIGRFRRAGRPTRALAGVSVGAWALLAAGRIYDYTIRESTPFIPGTADFYTTSYVESLARAGIALGVLAGLTLLSRRRGPAMELIGRLGQGETRSSAAVSAALRDPGLDILTWSDADSAFVDEGGVVVRDPSDAGRRAVTTLESGGRVVAAIRHDPALLEDPVLLESVAAALRLSVDNDRLAAELSERLRDVEASRKRIVEAADAERRRIERNLHDGAQQQLLAAALALRMLEARHRDDPDLTAALRKATTTLTHALEDLRRLARGIHPAVLEEAGLAAALEGLSDSLAVPLDVHNHLPEPPPEALATTLFYVAAEAVANVAKHARATRADIDLSLVGGRLRMVVSDDGVGGAAPAGGSGLQGMQDRILAIGGRIAIESPPGGGTRVTVEVPCE